MSKRRTRTRTLMRASQAGSLLLAAGTTEADTEARTLRGIVVPYGRVGATSQGRLKFAKGSLVVSDPKRIKLLREHDQAGDVIGHGVSFEDTDAGLLGTFRVPETPAGDQALLEAANGLRDAFSVGVQLDDKTVTHLRRAQGASVDAAGQLREVSLVSVPAFDDARLAASGADLAVTSWAEPGTPTSSLAAASSTSSASAATPTPTGGSMFTEAQRARLAQLLAQASLTDAETTERDLLQQLATAAGVTVTTGEPGQAGSTPQQPATASAAPSVPAVVPAVAGAAHVTSQPSTYGMGMATASADGVEHSLVRDLFTAGVRNDAQAAERVERFNAELRDGNPASVQTLATAAVATRDDVDGAGTDLPSFFQPTPNRPDLMRRLVDVNRPLVSRLGRVPITNAQPFAIPTVGEFTGVGPHTEGTPHRPAGTLTLGGDTVQPTAVSGAWEASRELLDAANPALDAIATRAMLRDYQRQTEGKAWALFAALLAADPEGVVYGVDTPLELRAAQLDFVNDDEEAGDLLIVGKTMLRTLALDVDNDDRPQLPFVGPVNAQGTVRAGGTGIAVDGVEVVRSARLDTAVGAGFGVLARTAGILWAESTVLQFRFNEVLGPGVVKLALWAYSGAALLDTADVQLLASGADPTP